MAKRPVTEDPSVLAALVTGMGGTIIPGPTFQFELPRSKVREVVPEINKLNISVRKVGEYTTERSDKLFSAHTVVRLQLCRPQETEQELREAWFHPTVLGR
jgi:hypothetical protein